MRQILLILVPTLIVFYSQGQVLYTIQENSLVGKIDETGKVIIPTQFNEIGDFVNTLAVARKEGLYGYIDKKGNFKIPPIYDYARDFENGYALVFKNSKPYFIDSLNNILFEHDYVELSLFNKLNYCIAKEKDGALFIIDKNGKKVSTQKFHSVKLLESGLFLVQCYPDENSKNFRRIMAVMDRFGQFIIKPNMYSDISVIGEGFLKADINYTKTEVLNSLGQVKFRFKNSWSDFDIEINEGLFIINTNHENYDAKYNVVVDTNGNEIINNPKFKRIAPFQNGVSIAHNGKRNYWIIDKKGNIRTPDIAFTPIGEDSYRLDYEQFEKGVVFVKIDGNYRALDTSGQFVGGVAPIKYKIIGSSDGLLYSREEILDYSIRPKMDYWDPFTDRYFEDSEAITKSKPAPTQKGLRLIQTDTFVGYQNAEGEYVWHRTLSQEKARRYNTTSMTSGFLYAASGIDEKLHDPGGWGGCDNKSEKIIFDKQFSFSGLGIEIRKKDTDSAWNQAIDADVYLVNMDTLRHYFTAQDSRLDAVLQALHPDGEWKDIEFLRRSWCGNSYHTLYLDKGDYWQFSIPLFDGAIKTKMRIKIPYFTDAKSKEMKDLYSNEVEVGINPGQFWRKTNYYSTNIMDPYGE